MHLSIHSFTAYLTQTSVAGFVYSTRGIFLHNQKLSYKIPLLKDQSKAITGIMVLRLEQIVENLSADDIYKRKLRSESGLLFCQIPR